MLKDTQVGMYRKKDMLYQNMYFWAIGLILSDRVTIVLYCMNTATFPLRWLMHTDKSCNIRTQCTYVKSSPDVWLLASTKELLKAFESKA